MLILKIILHGTFMMQSRKTTTMTIHLVLPIMLSPNLFTWSWTIRKGKKNMFWLLVVTKMHQKKSLKSASKFKSKLTLIMC
jgi:hypothetical protein